MADTVLTAVVPTKQPRTHKSGARKSHIVVMLGSLVAGSAATVTFLDSWQKVLTDFGFTKSEAFVLADQTAQGELVRQMTHLVSQRLFWIARYTGDVADSFPAEDLNEAWKRYNDSVITWNENYMVNVLLTEKFFGTPTKNQLADINWLLHRINTCLNRIRYRSLYEAIPFVTSMAPMAAIRNRISPRSTRRSIR